jgi:spore cortex formation protein SpoVR/YcgB (stage V sporulation)
MKTSSLEITNEEYLIKLRKEDFDLSFINQLLKRIQNEQHFFSFKQDDESGDIISRKADPSHFARFDDLREK